MSCNVHVFCKLIFSNKFGFILETVFSYKTHCGHRSNPWPEILRISRWWPASFFPELSLRRRRWSTSRPRSTWAGAATAPEC